MVAGGSDVPILTAEYMLLGLCESRVLECSRSSCTWKLSKRLIQSHVPHVTKSATKYTSQGISKEVATLATTSQLFTKNACTSKE